MKKMIVAMVAATLGLSTAAVAQTAPPAPQNTINIGGSAVPAATVGAVVAGAIVLGVIVSDDSDSTTTTPGT